MQIFRLKDVLRSELRRGSQIQVARQTPGWVISVDKRSESTSSKLCPALASHPGSLSANGGVLCTLGVGSEQLSTIENKRPRALAFDANVNIVSCMETWSHFLVSPKLVSYLRFFFLLSSVCASRADQGSEPTHQASEQANFARSEANNAAEAGGSEIA